MSRLSHIQAQPSQPTRLLGTALGLALVSSLSHAGDSEAEAGMPAPAKPQVTDLDSIKVRSSVVNPVSPKFTAPLLDTPRAISVIPARVISETNSTTLMDALRTVPGITFGAGEGGNPVGDRPFIRGFDAGADTYIDGIRDSGSQSRETFDIEQIDVIKGPSSAYTGPGAAGGSINIVSKVPEAHDFTNASVGLGSDNYKRATLDANYLLSQHIAARLNVMDYKSDVPGRDALWGKRFGIAPSVTFGIGTPNRLTLDYYHLNTNELPDSGIPLNGPYTTGSFAGTGDGQPVHTGRDNFYGLKQRDFRKTKADIGTIRFEHDFGDDFTLRNTTRYGKTSNDYIWTNPDDSSGNVPLGLVYRSPKSRIADTRTLAEQLNLSGRFSTGALQHDVAMGLEYQHLHTDVDGYTVTVPATTATRSCGPLQLAVYTCTPLNDPNPSDPWLGSVVQNHNPVHTTSTDKAFYAFDTITFNEHWLANLGTRYDRYDSQADGINTSTRNGPLGPFDYRNRSDFWSWQAGLIFKPIPITSIYAAWGTSSNPTGVANGEGTGDNANLALQTANLAPQKSRNLELGNKWELFDQRLNLDLAVFRSEVTNARVAIDPTTTELVGSKRVDGVELDVSGKLTDRWTVFGGVVHLNPRLTDNGPLAANAINNGNVFPNTAKNSASLWSTYQLSPALNLGVGAFAMSKVYGNVQNTKSVPGYVRYDAMVSWQVNRMLNLQLNLQNLTDKLYFQQIYTNHYALEGPGRAATLTANLHF